MDVPVLLCVDGGVYVCVCGSAVFWVGPETPEKSALVISAVAPVNSY